MYLGWVDMIYNIEDVLDITILVPGSVYEEV